MPNQVGQDREPDPANFTKFTGVRLGWDTWSEVCELADVGEASNLHPTGVYVDQDGHPTSSFPGDKARIGVAFPPNDNGVSVAVEGDYLFREPDGTIYIGKIAYHPGPRITHAPKWGQIIVDDSGPLGYHWEGYPTNSNPLADVTITGISIKDDGTPWEKVPAEEEKDRLGIQPDWTCDPSGRSNSSILFEDLVTEISYVIERNRFDDKRGMARLLLAQLAHKHHLAPQVPELNRRWEWDV